VRYGWKLPKRIEAPHPREVLSPVVGVVTPAQSLEQRLKQDAEATRVGLSTATRKASVSLAERDGDYVVYVSARLKDVVSSAAQLHGWNQPAAVNVNIANIPMPTEEERAEMRALDDKLDGWVLSGALDHAGSVGVFSGALSLVAAVYVFSRNIAPNRQHSRLGRRAACLPFRQMLL
jgi:hypothetical protein